MTGLLISHKAFRRFALAFLVSRAGDFMLSVGMVVFALRQTGAVGWVAAAAALRIVPHVLLSGVGGALGSRFGRRYLVASDLARAALNVALTVAALAGSMPGVLLASVAAQVAGAGYFATCSSLVPRLVDDGETASANATITAIDSVSLLAGPAIAAVLMTVTAPAVAFGLNSASFLVSALVVGSMRLRATGPATGRTDVGPGPESRTGSAWRALVEDAQLRAITVSMFGINLVVGMTSVVFVVVSMQIVGTGDAGAGYLLAAYGAGGLVGAVVAGRLLSRPWARQSATGALVMTGLATAAMAEARVVLVAWLLAATIGALGGYMEVLSVTVVQEARPDSTATMCGALDSLCYGAVLVGLLVSPLLVLAVGGRGCLYVVGGTLLLLAVAPRAGVRTSRARTSAVRTSAVRTTSRTAAPAG